ncbi:Uncharacterised protein [Listeria grayi]|uniref:Uncharacterized protein n=1 Tax=Listeria grayi TaxID=1641 RepID=A0A378MC74_LISGR|nr:Uncharacterised protein [Listeria grayi]
MKKVKASTAMVQIMKIGGSTTFMDCRAILSIQ